MNKLEQTTKELLEAGLIMLYVDNSSSNCFVEY